MASSGQSSFSHSQSIRSPSLRSIDMNEQGVYCLQQRQFEEAIACFGAALRTLNEMLSSHTLVGEPSLVREETGEDMVGADADAGVSSRDTQTLPSHREDKRVAIDAPAESHDDGSCSALSTHPRSFQDIPTQDIRNRPQPHLQDHTSVIYAEPISVSKFLRRSHAVAELSYTNVVEMSISVMFNFALAHHLYATSGQSENPEKVIDQAVALYELTHSLQLQEGIELSFGYTMGTICNLGHIHRLRGDTEKSTKCFQHLLSIFCFLQSQNSLEIQHSDSSNEIVENDGQHDDHFASSSSCLRRLLESDVIFYSVSYLFLCDKAAAAA